MDLNNGNNFGVKAIKKEMNNVGIAFEILDEDKSAPVGWSNESGHLIFNVKMDFTQNTDGFWMVIDLPIPLDLLML